MNTFVVAICLKKHFSCYFLFFLSINDMTIIDNYISTAFTLWDQSLSITYCFVSAVFYRVSLIFSSMQKFYREVSVIKHVCYLELLLQ